MLGVHNLECYFWIIFICVSIYLKALAATFKSGGVFINQIIRQVYHVKK